MSLLPNVLPPLNAFPAAFEAMLAPTLLPMLEPTLDAKPIRSHDQCKRQQHEMFQVRGARTWPNNIPAGTEMAMPSQ